MAKTFRDWPQVLAAALADVQKLPPTHRPLRPHFGAFSDGSGYYYSIDVSYELGNTKTATDPHIPDDYQTRRAEEVIAAWIQARDGGDDA